MKARVTVTLKSGVLDPQGKAIEGGLAALGFAGVASAFSEPARTTRAVAEVGRWGGSTLAGPLCTRPGAGGAAAAAAAL